MNSKKLLVSIFCCFVLTASHILCAATITGPLDDPGSLKKWHKVTITFGGPHSSESADPNPFLDYRLNVTFTRPGGTTLLVPGYYCADGDAANTGAKAGNKWRVHLAPDEVGTWSFSASFRTGADVAVSDNAGTGTPDGFDGESGVFTVEPTENTGRDHRGKGRLDYVGKHHLRFAETGEYFLKCGADAPENFLAYEDFDGDFKNDGRKDNLVKDWAPHVKDWKPGDPTWQGGKGKGIIGAINYLASKGMNAFSFLTLNIDGDDRNVFMYTTYNERERFDVSRLEQWEIVFEHGDRRGMYLHFKTQETENELLLNNGNLGVERKLYYRELIARFGHHLALNWNLGEEINDASTAQKAAWANYFWAHDPYQHHIVIHNGDNHYDLLGSASKLTGFSLQTGRSDFSQVFSRTKNYIDRSVAAGKPWVVACDEPGDAQHALVPDLDDPEHNNARKNALWGNIMAGGAGVEWYFGYSHDHSDLTCEDWRSRDNMWTMCKYALDFFVTTDEPGCKSVPFQNMSNDDSRVGGTGNHCLYGHDDTGKPCLVVQTDNGGSTSVNAPAAQKYKVGWMSAKTGAWQYRSDVNNHPGGNINFTAPSADEWALLLYDWSAEKDPPTPDPAQWDTVPTATSEREIAMMAVEGMDAQSPPVEYYFEELSGNCHGDDSGWQTGPVYVDANLAPGTQYTYRVKMRDQAGNEAAWSPQASATTLGVSDPDPPSPDPAQFNEPPHNTGEQAIRMSAVEGTDLNGPVEYYFEETSGNPGGSSSGWQTDPIYTDTDLQAATQYSYTVKMRDAVCNESRPSDTTIACTRPDTVDIVADARINGLDLEKMLSHWLEDNCCTADLCEYSDLDANGRIGFGDYAILAENWLAVLGPQTIDFTFSPIDDAYLQDSTGYNNQQLKVQPSGPARIAYLKFDVAGIPYGYDVTNVEVKLTENGDTGNGTLRFYRGSHNDWAEETISAGNAPDVEDQVGSRSGSVGGNQTITVDIRPLVTGNGIFTVIIKMDAGGNDIWFGSKESPKVPNLIVTARRKD